MNLCGVMGGSRTGNDNLHTNSTWESFGIQRQYAYDVQLRLTYAALTITFCNGKALLKWTALCAHNHCRAREQVGANHVLASLYRLSLSDL